MLKHIAAVTVRPRYFGTRSGVIHKKRRVAAEIIVFVANTEFIFHHNYRYSLEVV